MARYCPLFSGSSGNCTYIASANGGILIDAGVSAKRIETALMARNIDPCSITTVFITHEHSDHVKGLRVLTKRFGYEVVASRGTMEALEAAGALHAGGKQTVLESGCVEAAGMQIVSFKTSHDSAESCGYVVETSDYRKIAVATDTGKVTDHMRLSLTGCHLVQIESNHDVRMLGNGSYPYYLKQRILADTGHLSNEHCARELPSLAESGVTRFVLAHLSRENNVPALAYQTSKTELDGRGFRENVDYILRVASPDARDEVMVL